MTPHDEARAQVNDLVDEWYRKGGMKDELTARITAALEATHKDYEDVLADHRQLVHELDVLMNGEGAAPHASLCDIVAQFPHWNATLLAAERRRVVKLIKHQQGWSLMLGIQGLTTTVDGEYVRRKDLLAAIRGAPVRVAVGDWVQWHIPFGPSGYGVVVECAPHYVCVDTSGIHQNRRVMLEPQHMIEVRTAQSGGRGRG